MADLFTRDGARKRVEPLSRRLKSAFTERMGFKLTALFFALLLWLLLSAEERVEELRPVRLAITTDTLVDLVSPLPEVRALVSGPRRELLRLTQAPPTIRRVITAQTPEFDTLELRAADVDVGGADVRVHIVQPREIPLQFRVTARRTVPVVPALRIVPDTGVALLGPPTVEPAQVTITGPRDRVNAIDSVFTIRVDVLVADTVRHAVAIDTAGLGVTVQPAQVRVLIPAARLALPEQPAAPNQGSPTPP